MGLIIYGQAVDVPGLTCKSWRDNPEYRLKIPQDGRPRRVAWIRSIILHTTRGIPGGKDRRQQRILSGVSPHVDAGLRAARWWSTSSLASGAHLVVDFDGEVVCLADLATEVTYHAGPVNEISIGVEIYQGGQAELYDSQLRAVVTLCDFLTSRFGIQRQTHYPYLNGPVARLARGGLDCVGVFGHRDVTNNRGAGDPGDRIFAMLATAGYEQFNFAGAADLRIWKQRQQALGIRADGIPGPQTITALGGKLWATRQM